MLKFLFNKGIETNRKLRDYQTKILEEAVTELDNGKQVLLGMCTGSGKTITTYGIFNRYLKSNSNFRVLILAHNQIVLRDNFDRLEFGLKGFQVTSSKDLNKDEYKKSNIIIAIPSTIHKHIAKLGHFDMIVIDEAHEYTDGKMNSKILSKYKKAKKLYLTASHGGFEKDKYHKILFSVMEALDEKSSC